MKDKTQEAVGRFVLKRHDGRQNSRSGRKICPQEAG
jgi:hypothetical protein